MGIVVAEFMDTEGLSLLDRSAEVRYEPDLWERPAALRAAAAAAVALVVRNRCRVDAALLAAAPRLRVVGRLGSGLDNLDLEALREARVGLVRAAGTNAVATAEFTLLLMLALARRAAPTWFSAPGPDWARRAGHDGVELCGRTAGLIGMGRVGQAVARRARALGMQVLCAHPGRSAGDPSLRDAGAVLVPLPDLLRRADFISLHAALRPGVGPLLGRRELALCQPSALLINTARGELLDEAALALALRDGWLAGAALDVRHPEPPPRPDPLDGVPRLIRTPHIAGLGADAQRHTGLQVAAGVLRALGVAQDGAVPRATAAVGIP